MNIHYTMEADELALYKLVFSIPKLINTSKVEVDVHRRLVGGDYIESRAHPFRSFGMHFIQCFNKIFKKSVFKNMC